MVEESRLDYDTAPPGYEWHVPRVGRLAKVAIWFGVALLLAAVLWFWVFPLALNLLPDNF